MKRVTIIGDSIAMAYGPVVKELLAGQVEIWQPEENAGTSAHVLTHLEEWFIDRPADLLHFNCGLHDLAIDAGKTEVRVRVDRYVANLREILARVQAGTTPLVWATITPVMDDWHRERHGFVRRTEDVLAYNAAALTVMGSLPMDDLHAVIMGRGREQCVSDDGVHMTPEGNRLLAETVAGKIREALEL